MLTVTEKPVSKHFASLVGDEHTLSCTKQPLYPDATPVTHTNNCTQQYHSNNCTTITTAPLYPDATPVTHTNNTEMYYKRTTNPGTLHQHINTKAMYTHSRLHKDLVTKTYTDDYIVCTPTRLHKDLVTKTYTDDYIACTPTRLHKD